MLPRHFNKIIFKRTPAAVTPQHPVAVSLPSILFNEPRSHPAFSISADDISIYFVPWARNPAVIRYLRKSQPPLSGQSTARSPHSSLVSSVAGIALVLDRCLFSNWPLRFQFNLPHPAICVIIFKHRSDHSMPLHEILP